MRSKLHQLGASASLFIFSSILLVSCGSLAPLTEQAKAADALKNARAVEAAVYSEAEFITAETAFGEGELLIVTNKKSKDNDKAKEQYLLSFEKAIEAYSNSVSPFTKRFLDETATRLEQAKQEKVHIASATLYEEAGTLNQTAFEELDQQRYSNAKATTMQARVTLTEAVAETRRLSNLTQEKAAIFKELLQKAAALKAVNATPKEYEGLLAEQAGVEEQTQQGYYQKSLAGYDALIVEGEALIALIEEKRRLAREEILSSEERLEAVKERNQAVEEEIEVLERRGTLEEIK